MDETKAWINEKDTALSTDDHGRDLAGVQALQRKHEALERDLAALEDKVNGEGDRKDPCADREGLRESYTQGRKGQCMWHEQGEGLSMSWVRGDYT